MVLRMRTDVRPLYHRILLAALVAGGVAAVILGVKYSRYHFFPKNFAVVEPGRLYRAGYCQPGPLKEVIERHGIRTILTLLSDEPDSADQRKEDAVARQMGVRILRVSMPGDGRGTFEDLDAAAEAMAAQANHPMLVHCYAGANRTGAAFVVWRVRHCGWTFEDAMDEAEAHGYSPRRNPELREHLVAYLARPSPATSAAAESE